MADTGRRLFAPPDVADGANCHFLLGTYRVPEVGANLLFVCGQVGVGGTGHHVVDEWQVLVNVLSGPGGVVVVEQTLQKKRKMS